MTRTEIATRARQVVVDHFKAQGQTIPTDFPADAEFMGPILKGDSLGCVEIVMSLEDEFEIELDDSIAAGLETFQQTVDHLVVELGAADQVAA